MKDKTPQKLRNVEEREVVAPTDAEIYETWAKQTGMAAAGRLPVDTTRKSLSGCIGVTHPKPVTLLELEQMKRIPTDPIQCPGATGGHARRKRSCISKEEYAERSAAIVRAARANRLLTNAQLCRMFECDPGVVSKATKEAGITLARGPRGIKTPNVP